MKPNENISTEWAKVLSLICEKPQFKRVKQTKETLKMNARE